MRNKLIELLMDCPDLKTEFGLYTEYATAADWLIEHGVQFATDIKDGHKRIVAIDKESALFELCFDCHMPDRYPDHGCPDPCYQYGGVANLPEFIVGVDKND